MSTETNILDAINHYHDLCTPARAEATWEVLVQGLHDRNLFFGDRPLVSVLRPHLFSVAEWAYLQGASTLLVDAFNKAYMAMMANPMLRQQVYLTPEEEYLVHLDTGYDTPVPTARLDSFFSHDYTLQFLEYNAESPAAMAYGDLLAEVFAQTPVMQAFQERYAVRPLLARHHVVDVILNIYYQWRGNRQALPTIAIVDWKGVPTTSEFYLFQDYLGRHGITTVIVEPDDLEYRKGILYAGDAGGGLAIDFVYKRVLSTELLQRYGLNHPIIDALADGKICMMNPFQCKILHKKASLAVVSDERNAYLFDDSERAVIDAHIPWTRVVEERKTLYQGQEIDLLPFCVQNQDQLVLKPNDEYGGKGVLIGWETDATSWETALRAALHDPSIVQERVKIAYEDYPALDATGQVVLGQRLVDSDPFVFHGQRVDGCLTRLSTVTLLNVTAGGGSTVPTFVVG